MLDSLDETTARIVSARCTDPDCQWNRDARDYNDPAVIRNMIQHHVMRYGHKVHITFECAPPEG
jgi:hypothetical protein